MAAGIQRVKQLPGEGVPAREDRKVLYPVPVLPELFTHLHRDQFPPQRGPRIDQVFSGLGSRKAEPACREIPDVCHQLINRRFKILSRQLAGHLAGAIATKLESVGMLIRVISDDEADLAYSAKILDTSKIVTNVRASALTGVGSCGGLGLRSSDCCNAFRVAGKDDVSLGPIQPALRCLVFTMLLDVVVGIIISLVKADITVAICVCSACAKTFDQAGGEHRPSPRQAGQRPTFKGILSGPGCRQHCTTSTVPLQAHCQINLTFTSFSERTAETTVQDEDLTAGLAFISRSSSQADSTPVAASWRLKVSATAK